MIRTSQHNIKFSNKQKQKNLHIFINEYRKCIKHIINYIWFYGYTYQSKNINYEFSIQKNLLNLPSMLTSDIIKKSELNTFLTGRALKCCLTQAASLINASVEKQRKRLYIYQEKKQEGKTKHQLFRLIKKIKENIPQKPNCDKVNPELNSICCSYKDIKSNMFNGFFRLTSITKDKMEILIPIKYTKHSRKFSDNSELKTSFLIRENSIDFRWELPEVEKKTEGKTVGADQGLLDVLTLSDRQVTPKENKDGYSLSKILEIMSRKLKGSKSFKRSQEHRKNFINWSINQLDFSEISKINLEKIWNIGYKSSRSRKLGHWTNTIIRDKIESVGEELGVQVDHQGSIYMSQRCSVCGMVKKRNRKGKIYECTHCGSIEDADYNASKNHELNLPEIPYSFLSLKKNISGFFWLESGIFDLDGRNLQFPLQSKA